MVAPTTLVRSSASIQIYTAITEQMLMPIGPVHQLAMGAHWLAHPVRNHLFSSMKYNELDCILKGKQIN